MFQLHDTRRREEDGARFGEKNQASCLAFVKLLRSTYIFHLSKEALTLLLDTKIHRDGLNYSRVYRDKDLTRFNFQFNSIRRLIP